MSSSDLLMLAKKCGVVKEGHFLLRSGLHSGVYVEKFYLLEHPEVLSAFVQALISKLDVAFDHVVGPALGGMIVAYEAARQLGIAASYAEKDSEAGFVLRRGRGISEGERILVVDDVMTTGGSVMKTIQAVERAGGQVVKTAVLVDRAVEPPEGLNYVSALRYVLPAYTPEECPLCARGIPLLSLGGTK